MIIFYLCILLSVATPGKTHGKCPFAAMDATPKDVSRAKQVSNTQRKLGGFHGDIARKINDHVSKHQNPRKECENFSLEELNQLVRDLWCHMDSSLNEIYSRPTWHVLGGRPHISKPHDLRRRRFETLEEYEQSWSKENYEQKDILREAKCAETLMLWTHHLSEDSQQKLNNTLPIIPVYNQTSADTNDVYRNSFSCVTGHNLTAGHTSDHKLPHWPTEVHYTATGHGPYPFWLGGGPPPTQEDDDSTVGISSNCRGASGSSHIEVWWSEPKAAEKFYHASCSMKNAGYTKDVPCYHLMIGAQPNPQAYLYTEDESWCCNSQPSSGGGGSGLNAEILSSVTSDFMDLMTLSSETSLYSGTYYKGKVKKYTMELPWSEPVSNFWYITDMDDNPVEQGESPQIICHEYNQTSFKATELSEDVFAIPDACKTTTKSCAFP